MSTARAGHRRTGRALAWFILVVGVLTVGIGSGGAAFAHNVLTGTDPADQAQVAVLPDTVTLTFNQPVLGIGAAVQVVGPGGDVADGKPVLIDREVREKLRPGSPPGTYEVRWRVTSADGHPISGEFSFTAAAGNGGSSSVPATPAATPAGASGNSSPDRTWLILIAAGLLMVGAFVAALRRAATARRRAGPAAGSHEETSASGSG